MKIRDIVKIKDWYIENEFEPITTSLSYTFEKYLVDSIKDCKLFIKSIQDDTAVVLDYNSDNLYPVEWYVPIDCLEVVEDIKSEFDEMEAQIKYQQQQIEKYQWLTNEVFDIFENFGCELPETKQGNYNGICNIIVKEVESLIDNYRSEATALKHRIKELEKVISDVEENKYKESTASINIPQTYHNHPHVFIKDLVKLLSNHNLTLVGYSDDIDGIDIEIKKGE